MKQIERLIQFAIDNGYMPKKDKHYFDWTYEIREEYWNFTFWSWWDCHHLVNLIQTITSKPFIEAVAYWNWKKSKAVQHYYKKNWSYPAVQWPDFLSTNHKITVQQAIAIRDNKLPEFIDNLLLK